MNLLPAVLLVFIAIVFASLNLEFFALIMLIILVLMATTDMGSNTAPAGTPEHAAAEASKEEAKIKKTTITKDGGTKTKIVDYVSKDEVKWSPPGKPKSWGKMPNEEFGSALYQTAMLPVKATKAIWDLLLGK